MSSNDIQYLQGTDFTKSLKTLMQKGGKYQKAGDRVKQAWASAHMGEHSYTEVFAGLTTTNNGENRIENCVKYDLTGYSRLVVTYSNNICIFLFTGDHDTVDAWLEKNKGMNFVAKKQGENLRVEPVFVSDKNPGKHGLIYSDTDWMTNGPVIQLLSQRYREKLLKNIDEEIIEEINLIESDSDEDTILAVVSRIQNPDLSDAILDVLLALRSSDQVKAKSRIDLLERDATPVSELTKPDADKIISSDTTVRLQDLPADLFEHFIRTADFKAWMLFLHPDQREFVNRDFTGPTRLAGVSGSGKTCVVIHRALRLARQSPDKRVLVLTLNEALARLIGELIDSAAGATRPANIEIKSVFDLCRDKLIKFNPSKRDYFGKRIAQRNEFAVAEHIDEIWEEFYHCRNNNHDAEVMFEVARTLLVRKVFPQDYLQQELDYLRSAFAPHERSAYLEMERSGRVVPLERRYREMVISGLEGWERKMNVVGAIDDVGIVTSLYEYLDQLDAEYDHVLVDEVQDLGTLELKVIRRITKEGENDIYLCGDAAQSVQTKYSDMKAAGIDLPSARWIKLNQNYRNSRQILTAAHAVLTKSFASIPQGTTDLEIIPPEFANFSSAKPLLLKATSMEEELAMSLAYVGTSIADSPNKKACIALCGYSLAAVEILAAKLDLPVLCGRTDVSSHAIFLSDLEQTKGFEFDLMVVLNCSESVIPHPDLPAHESFRELCKLYVALTRAKTDLFVSFHGVASRFLTVAEEHFTPADWKEHVEEPKLIDCDIWPSPSLSAVGDQSAWSVPGKEFLRLRDAVGLSQVAQDEILQHVTGRSRFVAEGKGKQKQQEWNDFNVFIQAMSNPRIRLLIISDEVWLELSKKFRITQPQGGSPLQVSAASGEIDEIAIPTMTPNNLKGKQVIIQNAVKLYRHEDILKFSLSKHTAHILASFMIAQEMSALSELEIGKPMSYEVLEHLIPRHSLAEFRTSKHLRDVRNRNAIVALTKSGVDACLSLAGLRLSEAQDLKTMLSQTTEAEVIACRLMILKGMDHEHENQKFYSRQFDFSIFQNEIMV